MSLNSWLRGLRAAVAPNRDHSRKPRHTATRRPRFEVLENRTVPSGYQQTNLVGNLPGAGHFTDSNLNGWGITAMPDGSFCVANAFTTGLATFYDRSGHVLPQTIAVPDSPTGSAALGLPLVGHPTGVVYNDSSDFVITANGKSAPARLIFDSLDGILSGWNPDVDPTHAIVIRDTFADGAPSAFTGLQLTQNSQGHNVLYAADFLNNRVEMIDGNFNTIGTFSDPTATDVDARFHLWSVQNVGDDLYVTYANLTPGKHGGVVDRFNTDGVMLNRLAANAPGAGPLENPWGITQAPANFGVYSNDLLVGNVAGAGNINVYDPTTGTYLGQMRQPNGDAIAIKGLWDMDFGDGPPTSGPTNELFFSAGPNHPGDANDGLFGVIRAAGDQGGNGGGHAVREAAAPAHPVHQTLTRAQLQRVVHQALADWQSAGATAAQLAQLRQVRVSIQALPASYLGEETGNQVWISPNAAGWGWNLGASKSTHRMDLRAVLDHEFGHVLGLEDSGDLQDVMGETLAAGIRRLPSVSDLGGVLGQATVPHLMGYWPGR